MDALRRSAVGDWSVLKGDEYQLLYAVWLLLTREAESVGLFAGNDLLYRRDECDVWVQAKHTADDWRLSRLLFDNLLPNLVRNACSSEAEGRAWQVQFVTTARVKATPAQVASLADGTAKGEQLAGLQRCLASMEDLDRPATEVRELALSILGKLVETKPTPDTTLRAECEREVALRYPSRDTVQRVLDQLAGAILRDGAALGPEPVWLGGDWLDRAAGRPLRAVSLLQSNAAAACDAAATQSWPHGWTPECHVVREPLAAELARFRGSAAKTFVLTGPSGVGKSAALAHWLTVELAGQARVWFDARESVLSLDELCAAALADFSDGVLSAAEARKHVATVGARPLVVVDDIRPGPHVEQTRRGLAALARQCDTQGWQLVLSLTDERWQALLPDLRLPAVQTAEGISSIYVLGDYDEDEMRAVLERSLGPDRGPRVAAQLGSHDPLVLRRPYFLDLYLREATDDTAADPLSIDGLVANHVGRRVDEAGKEIRCGETAAREAWQALVAVLWGSRGVRLRYADAVSALNQATAGAGSHLLGALGDQHLLRLGPVDFVDEPVAAWCLARHWLDTADAGAPLPTGLDPVRDGLLVQALLRLDPEQAFERAERLTDADRAWAASVAAGLAEAGLDDWRTLALLTVLMRPTSMFIADHDVCAAMGLLAAKSSRARAWLSAMFTCRDAHERHRAGTALRETMRRAPEATLDVLQQRLGTTVVDRQREAWLRDSLDPLLGVAYDGAAQLALAFSDGAHEHFSTGKLRLERAEARGHLADYISDVREGIWVDMTSADELVAEEAARALCRLALDRPAEVLVRLRDAIASGSVSSTLSEDVWWAVMRAARKAPLPALDIVEATVAEDWLSPLPAVSVALLVGGLAAGVAPGRAAATATADLGHRNERERAQLAEVQAASLWLLATHVTCAEPALRAMADDRHEAADPWLRPYLLRGSLTAWLGLVVGSVVDPVEWVYHDGDQHAVYLSLSALALKAASVIRDLDRWPEFADRVRAYVESISCAALLADDGRTGYYPTPTQEGAELLAMVATGDPRAASWIRGVKPDWAAMYALNRLFGSDDIDGALHQLAVDLCDAYANGGEAEAVSQRVEVLAHLDPMVSTTVGWMGGSERARGLAHAAGLNPDAFLRTVAARLRDREVVPILAHLHTAAVTWPVLLVGRVFSRMLADHAIDRIEAQDLVNQVRDALSGLPDSPARCQWLATYDGIAGVLAHGKAVLATPPATDDLIAADLRFAVECLRSSTFALAGAISAGTVVESEGWRLEPSSLSYGNGFGQYAIVGLPAARLVAVAVTGQDPVGAFMRTRYALRDLLSRHSLAFEDRDYGDDVRDRALQALVAAEAQFAGDGSYWRWRGLARLIAGHYGLAIADLSVAIDHPTASVADRAGSLYNLACSHARLNQAAEARTHLERSLAMRSVPRKDMLTDPDFESVRSEPWFLDLLPPE